ncbi:DNA ligase LigA-related protein [Clostridium zeae]
MHVCITYRMNTSIWGDRDFDYRAIELIDLQNQYRDIVSE